MGVKKLIKKLLLLLIITELVVFYIIFTDGQQQKLVTDAPYKLMDPDLQKANPAQTTMGTSINEEVKPTTTPD